MSIGQNIFSLSIGQRFMLPTVKVKVRTAGALPKICNKRSYGVM